MPTTVQIAMQSTLGSKFCKAASAGDVQAIRELVLQAKAKGIDLSKTVAADPSGRSAVFLAASKGHQEPLSVMLEAGCSFSYPSKSGDTPLHMAAAAGSEGCALLLIRYGADVNAPNGLGEVPIFLAACQGHVALIKALMAIEPQHLRPELDIQRASDGCTPLHAAAKRGDAACASALLDHRADLDLEMQGSTTALYVACIYNQHQVVATLVQRGANVQHRTATGQTPLFAAACSGCTAAIPLLLGARADPESREQRGCTPLIAAAQKDHTAVVRALLLHGADHTATLNDATAAQHAVRTACDACAAILFAHAATHPTVTSSTRNDERKEDSEAPCPPPAVDERVAGTGVS